MQNYKAPDNSIHFLEDDSFTHLLPAGSTPITEQEVEMIRAASRPSLSIADFDAALTAHLDATARTRRYDNRITCMVRAGFPGPFQVEALAFAQWADQCNAAAYQLLAKVQAGDLQLPNTTQELIDLLPLMVWPE